MAGCGCPCKKSPILFGVYSRAPDPCAIQYPRHVISAESGELMHFSRFQ